MWRINQLRKPWSAGAMKISCARQYLMRQEFPHRQDRKVYQLKWWRYSMLQCFLLRRCQVYAPHIKPGSGRCCSMFGSLVDSANTKTATFPETSSNRLADWRPRQEPLKELLTWVSSHLKLFKTKEMQRVRWNPQIPSLLYKKEERTKEAGGDKVPPSLLEM